MTDADLVRSAQAGDTAALGLLLARHRAGLRAVTVTKLGPDRADDAVQDACVVALRRISELRHAAAFGPWLRAIAHNVCLMELRRDRRELLLAEPPDEAVDDAELERHVLRAWLWGAVDTLPEEQRVAVMLRHFGHERSYEEIAEICAVPVGTVRSRLSAARRALGGALLAAAAPDARVDARTAAWRSRFAEAFDGLNHGRDAAAATLFAVDAEISARGRIGAPADVLPALLDDSHAGVAVHVGEVVAGAGVVVVDGPVDGPPGHCPPSFTWVAFHDRGRIARMSFHHPC
jgi:RNA polymerase sigma-70 factor (ECF subfamily)